MSNRLTPCIQHGRNFCLECNRPPALEPEKHLNENERAELETFREKARIQAKVLQDSQYRQMREPLTEGEMKTQAAIQNQIRGMQNCAPGSPLYDRLMGTKLYAAPSDLRKYNLKLNHALLMAGHIERKPVGDPATASMPKIIGRVAAIMVITIAMIVLGVML
jgi:hypothetical protein